jgi:hypothetical protein
MLYRLKWWNTKVVLDFSPFFSSILIIAVLQDFNVMTVLNFVEYYFGYRIDIFHKYLLLLPGIFLIFNFIYYRSPIKQAHIEKLALGISKRSKNIYDICVLVYFILSIFLLIFIGNLIRQNHI